MDLTPHLPSRTLSRQLRTLAGRSIYYRIGFVFAVVLAAACLLSLCLPAEFAQTNYKPKYSVKIYPTRVLRSRAYRSTGTSSANSTKGISFSSLTPDGEGGVWIGGQVLYSGLLLHATPAVTPGTFPDLRQIDDLCYPTPTSGWMLAGGAVYATHDHSHWRRVDVGQADDLKRIYFLNDSLGWVFGKSGVIYRTADGGKNWQKQYSGTDYEIKQIQFANAIDGWAVARKESTELTMFLLTRDGGDHWTEIPRGASAPVDKFWFLNDLEGWAIDYDNNIIHTTDRGWHWEIQRSGTNSAFVSIHFVDPLHGWAAGDGIVHTNDGGATWNYQIPSANQDGAKYFDQVYFSDSSHGWALGFFRVLFTTDGGKTWAPISDDWRLPTFDKAVKEQQARVNQQSQPNR